MRVHSRGAGIAQSPLTKWRWMLLRLTRLIWVRASLFAILGVLTALVSVLVEPLIPIDIRGKVGADAVGNILNILASSMLTVTTFSLSVMVVSFGSATQNVTPRATRLLMQDNTSQNVLSVFVGSFLFSLVGLITLGMGAYGGSGRVVLFAVTLGVIVLIIVSILRWVGHLTSFGRVGDTTRRVEEATQQALSYRVAHPCLGGTPLTSQSDIPKGTWAVLPERVGYVEYIDLSSLHDCAEANEGEIYLTATPGTFVDLHAPLARVKGGKQDANQQKVLTDAIIGAYSIADQRSFDQDPRFGLSVLSEVASRALSPALNDIGTAIDVIGRVVRLLSEFAKSNSESEPPTDVEFPRIHVAPLNINDLFEDAFSPIARDGAATVQVQIRLQKGFAALSAFGGDFRTAARQQSGEAYDRSISVLVARSDKDKLHRLVK